MARWWKLAAVLVLVPVAGCPRSAPVSIKGQVTLDGQPVGPGSISFLPEPGTDSRKASVAIEEGRYGVPADRGPSPGSFKVEINWARKTGRKVPSADPGIMMDETREAVPSKYNSQTTLTVEIKSGENVRDFHLKSR